MPVKQFINELKTGQKVDSVFLVTDKKLKKKKDGQDYLHIVLKDKTGQIEGKMWDNVDKVDPNLDQDDFVIVKGHIDSWKDINQLIINDIKKTNVKSLNLSDFLPSSALDVNKMFDEMKNKVSSFDNEYLKTLLLMFLDDNNINQKMIKAPAAQRMHNAYLGGLVEHIYTVMVMAENVCKVYEDVDRELLLTGVILHDIAKIDELSYERSIDYTDEGKLIGHLVMSCMMTNEKIKTIKDFPNDLKIKLEHMILAHHGLREWGSPKEPTTKEAMILHHLDNLDAKLGGFRDAEALTYDKESKWTVRSQMFSKELYRG